ncbi:hypothetical protein DVH05_005189 [Phytophthora capsici]|nr:hypothetical protein DVH05_005189 [Phytophthora capsici]
MPTPATKPYTNSEVVGVMFDSLGDGEYTCSECSKVYQQNSSGWSNRMKHLNEKHKNYNEIAAVKVKSLDPETLEDLLMLRYNRGMWGASTIQRLRAHHEADLESIVL